MLPTFLEKLGGLFDRRFIVAFWMPAFIFVSTLGAVAVAICDVGEALDWWASLSVTAKVTLGAAALFTVTLLGLLLQACTSPIVRLYLGYWPQWMGFLVEWGKARQRRVWPLTQVPPDRLMPTLLGNKLVAAYQYPFNAYRMNAPVWWPRLVPLLPPAFRDIVDSSLTPLLCLLNLSLFFGLSAIFGGTGAVVYDSHWWLFGLIWVGGFLLAFIFYKAAISQGDGYAEQIRVSFDLFRHEILKQMRFPLPSSPPKEWYLWDQLNVWIYNGDDPLVLPWNTENPPENGDGDDLHYDNDQLARPQSNKEVVVYVMGRPIFTVRMGGV